MGAIRAGGLVSGMNTEAIIDKIMEGMKKPIVTLQDKKYLLGIEGKLYSDLKDDLTGIKKNIFTLKLEETFKSKMSKFSDNTVASGSVDTSANTGSYALDVLQLARNATLSSRFTTARLQEFGAGTTGISGLPTSYDQQEGVHNVKVMSFEFTPQSNPAVTKSIAVSEFTANNNRRYDVNVSNNKMLNTFIDINGQITTPLTGSDSVSFQLTLSDSTVINIPALSYTTIGSGPGAKAIGDVKDINELLTYLEEDLNNEINIKMGTYRTQYVALRAEISPQGEWSLNVYNTSEYKFDVSATGTISDNLGFTGGSTKKVADTITKYVVADNLTELQKKLDGTHETSSTLSNPFRSVISGVILLFNDSTLAEGEFEIVQDSTMNVRKATKTILAGATIGRAIDVTKPLLESGLTELEVERIAGKFTVNGKTIDLGNYLIQNENKEYVVNPDFINLTLNDIMSMVSSSGSGASMSYNSTSESFTISSIKEGPVAVKTGSPNDTSSIFDVLNLALAGGATLSQGSTNGTLNINEKITSGSAGYTNAMNRGVFTINDIPIYIDPSKETTQDLMNKINRSGAGVKIIYDNKQDKFIITSDTIDVIKFGSSNDTSNALMVMGFLPDMSSVEYVGDPGSESVFKVDGQVYRRQNNKIDDVITGVTLNLTKVGTTVLEIDVNTEKSVNALAEFIKNYNTLMQKLSPEPISDSDRKEKMQPLSEEKKQNMNKEQLEEYMSSYKELHTKDFMMKSSSIRYLKNSLRSNIMGIINNSSTFKSLSDVGIDVAGKGDIKLSMKGFLLMDSTDLDKIKNELTNSSKLMANLRNNSQSVYEFFSDYREEQDPKVPNIPGLPKKYVVTVYSWSKRYEDMLNAFLDIAGGIGVKTRPDNAIAKQILNIDKQIDNATRLAEQEVERLWRQFYDMEQRIAQIQSQADYLNQISGQNSGKK